MTNQEIKTVGQTIAAETQIGGNTAERVGGVIEGIGDALDNKDAAVGYYLATMSGSTIYINASSYRLGTGGNLRAKMPAAATTACTLTVGNAQAVQLWYNGAAVSADNSWEAGEIVTIFYDGTRFMASNSQGGGGQFGSGEKIKDILLSQVLGAGTDAITSQKGVSDAIFNEIDISSIDTLKTLNDALAPSSSLKPTYYTVTATLSSVKLKVGSMAVISDNMRHVVTEIMATHYILDDAGNLTNEHSDAEIFFIYRSVKLSGGTLPDPAGTWTKWRYVNSSAWSTVAEKIKYDNSTSGLAANNMQGAVDELVEDASYYDALDLSVASYPSKIIGSHNTWTSVSGASSILIPVTAGERIHVVGNGNETGTIYAMLQTNSTSGTPTWATGYSGRITRGSDEIFTLIVPSDAHYLWFMFKNSQYSLMPNVYKVGHVSDLNNEQIVERTHFVDSWKFRITPTNSRRAYDYTLYYIEEGATFTVPEGMSVGYQTFAEDGAYGSEQTFSGWLTGTYTFPKDGWYRFIAKNASDTDVTTSEVESLNTMECVRRTKDYPETRFKLFKMDRLTGKLIVYTHEQWIAPQSTTQTLNDRFFELDGKPLSMSGNSEFFIIFFDTQYKRVSDTITTLGEWKTYISNYDCSSLGAKYIRIVAQKGNDYQNVYAIFTSGVKNSTYTSADVTVSVNSKTEIVADAADATGAIQQALFLAYIRGGKAILYEDDYILNSTTPWTDNNNAPKCCLWVPHIIDTTSQYSNEIQFFTIEGTIQPVSYNHGVRIILGEDVYDNVTDELPLSVIRSEYQTKNNVIGTEGGVAAIALKNMNILLPNNQKAITTIDLRYTHACNIENLNTMAGYSTLNWGHTNTPPIANPNCVGIRGLIGANWSVLSTFTNIEAFGYYIGIDWCGEHITGRNISVKYNYYGMTFAVLHWYGHQGHPIVLMNVLDEHSVCLPKFGKAGADCHQMVNILGYNLMFPSQATQGDITAMDARHHKAVDDNDDKYAWNGFIYYTNANDQSDGSIVGHNIQDFSFFEEGGFNIRCVNTCNYRIASDVSLSLMEPNFLQEVWSRTHNKLCIFDGTNWKSADGEVIYEYPTYSLSGVVTSDGSPVSGASVKYTYQGVDYTTTTGSDGSYSLTVPQFAGVIEVSKSGYITFGRRIKMTAATTLNVVLNAE